MKRMAEAKETYDNIPIPEELSERVMLEVRKAEEKHNKKITTFRRASFMKKGFAAVAAIAVLFTAGVNTSEAFAQGVSEIPLLGDLARIVTFRSYETKTEDLQISVDIPSVEMISQDLQGLEKSVNQEIYTFCEQYAQEAITRAEEYRQAFLETGGTEEEWAAHQISIKVWYEVKAQSDQYLSLAVMGSENWTSAYSEARYYNLDLQKGKWITLKDILGDAYAQTARESIVRQAELLEKETGMEYWLEDWTGVDENTGFYMNQAGNPVIVLEKYEIAPGAAGVQEFEIWQDNGSGLENGAGKAPAQENGSSQEDEATVPFQEDYEDNFAVDTEAIVAYAQLIKTAVAEKDLEKLADLTGFPVYVGFPEEGLVVETREDFLALDPQAVFTDDMVRSMEGCQESSLSPSMAGFTMYDQDGAPSITFEVQDGKLAITGINY